ncbi:MAG: M15 family metallopeptidase [Bacteroidota bacterium]|nr:M15 family metallopeptidase [Bacteroidota bacterium]
MSYQLLKQDVLFYQRFLKSAGFYNDLLDGQWGPVTNKADADFVDQSKSISQQYGTFDLASESNVITLIPKAQIEARKFLKITKDNHLDIRILSGTRTYDEQNCLYAHGRNGNRQPVVTNARGGQSNHNFGIAWDIGVFDTNGNYVENDAGYKSFAAIVLPLMGTIEWGGNWISFKDYPHYQLKPVSENETVIRQLFESGNVYV